MRKLIRVTTPDINYSTHLIGGERKVDEYENADFNVKDGFLNIVQNRDAEVWVGNFRDINKIEDESRYETRPRPTQVAVYPPGEWLKVSDIPVLDEEEENLI